VGAPGGHAEAVEEGGHAAVEVRQGLGGQADVVLCGEHGDEVEGLEDEPDVPAPEPGEAGVGQGGEILPVHEDLAGVEVGEAGDGVEKRALAGAGRAHDGDEFARGDLEVHARQGLDGGRALPEGFDDAADLEGRGDGVHAGISGVGTVKTRR